MGWDDLFKLLSDIAAADSQSYWIVGGLTLIAFLIMRAMLPVKGLAIVFAPALFWGGLAGIYTATVWGFVLSTEKAVNVVAASVLGMVVALLVMVALTRLADVATRARTPLAAPAEAARRPRL